MVAGKVCGESTVFSRVRKFGGEGPVWAIVGNNVQVGKGVRRDGEPVIGGGRAVRRGQGEGHQEP